MTLLQSASNSWKIDVSYRCHNGWECIERTKSDNNNTDSRITYHVSKKRLTNRHATSTPLQSHCRNPHWIPDRLMYDTGATMGEKASKEQKVTVTERQKDSPLHKTSPYESTRHIYSAPKLLPPSASNSWKIDVSYRCSNGWEGIERTKTDNNRATKSTYLISKNRLTNRVATATPLRWHFRNPHWIPDRLMYDTCIEIG